MTTYDDVCNAKTKKEMQKLFDLVLTECSKKFGGSVESHRTMQLSNVGYFAGYYDNKTRRRVDKWLHAVHPIFGKTNPSASESFNAGIKRGQKAR